MRRSYLCAVLPYVSFLLWFFFFFNDAATTEISTLSLHAPLPISRLESVRLWPCLRMRRAKRAFPPAPCCSRPAPQIAATDRKSTRLNSSHSQISYAVFCLKKKKARSGLGRVTVEGKKHGEGTS